MEHIEMSELGDDSIYFNKNTIDSERYFQLFDKYIPVFDKTSNILIFSISNPVTIMRMMEKNPGARYIIVDEKETFSVVQLLVNDRDFECVYINIDDFDWYNINMKFDCVIMNPPYSKSLHLKVLSQAIGQLKNENSVIVNLSPIRWLQDPITQYKKNSDYFKFEKTVSKHIADIDIIDAKTANACFSAGLFANLAIYICNNKGGYNYKNIAVNHIAFNKITKKILDNKISNLHSKVIRYYEDNEVITHSVKISLIHGNPGKKDFYDVITSQSKLVLDTKLVKGQFYFSFKTKLEQNNFYKTLQLMFFKYANYLYKTNQHIELQYLPWLGDIVNPRTGLKGYKSDWTNEDLYKVFNITSEEQKVIEDTMKQYM